MAQCREIDVRQAAEAEPDGTLSGLGDPRSGVIRAAVGQRIAHGIEGLTECRPPRALRDHQPGYSAHEIRPAPGTAERPAQARGSAPWPPWAPTRDSRPVPRCLQGPC